MNPFLIPLFFFLGALCGCLLLRRRVIRSLTAPENPRLTAFLIRNLFLS